MVLDVGGLYMYTVFLPRERERSRRVNSMLPSPLFPSPREGEERRGEKRMSVGEMVSERERQRQTEP